VEPQGVLDMRGGPARYRRFVRDGLKEGHRDEYYWVEDQRFLGGEGFGEKLKRKAEGEDIAGPKKPLRVAFRGAGRGVKVAPEVLEAGGAIS
jgi:hypothetical protein